MEEIRIQIPFITDDSVNRVINQIEEIPTDQEMTIKYYSYGGSVGSTFELGEAIQKREGETIAKIPVMAASAAALLLPFFDRAIASNRARFLIHPVNSYHRKMRDMGSKDVMETLTKRIDENEFERVSGRSLNDVITNKRNPDDNYLINEIWLNAEEAMQVGLIDEIYEINAEAKNEAIEQILMDCPLQSYKEKYLSDKGVASLSSTNLKNNNVMTLDEFKTGNSALFDQIVETATIAERERISTLNEYREFDPQAVNSMIENGEQPTPAFFKTMANNIKLKLKGENLDDKNTQEIETETETKNEVDQTVERIQQSYISKL